MKNIIKIAIMILTLSLLCSCSTASGGDGGINADTDPFVLKATVSAVGERLEVEVIESDYAFGPYWVIISDATEFVGKGGESIKKSDIKSGDTVEITYSGQVMMSYPPQIVAHKIKVI